MIPEVTHHPERGLELWERRGARPRQEEPALVLLLCSGLCLESQLFLNMKNELSRK